MPPGIPGEGCVGVNEPDIEIELPMVTELADNPNDIDEVPRKLAVRA